MITASTKVRCKVGKRYSRVRNLPKNFTFPQEFKKYFLRRLLLIRSTTRNKWNHKLTLLYKRRMGSIKKLMCYMKMKARKFRQIRVIHEVIRVNSLLELQEKAFISVKKK
ncbi:hypothetical protein ACFL56_02315 [Candidatus Margulisiibacteriota bacterium]